MGSGGAYDDSGYNCNRGLPVNHPSIRTVADLARKLGQCQGMLAAVCEWPEVSQGCKDLIRKLLKDQEETTHA